MALPFPDTTELRNRGTFAFHNPTASSMQFPGLDSRLNCRADALGDCTSDTFNSAGSAAQINSLVDCIIVPDLTLSMRITRRVGSTITLADVQEVIDYLTLGYTVGGQAIPGLYTLTGVSPG